MEKDNNNNREKLTLKLKLPTAADPKVFALKTAENKRISNSMVQVAIKGRRNSTGQNVEDVFDSKNLSRREIESRKMALTSSDESETKNFDILSKIRDKNLQELKEKEEKKSLQIKEKLEDKKDDKKEEVVKEIIEEVKPTVAHNFTSFKVDDFDIRNKIKASVASENSKKEERQKVLEERKKSEIEKIQQEQEKERERRNPVKSSVVNKKDEIEAHDDGAAGKKSKNSFKEKRSSGRRLLQTFIVDEDGDESYGRQYRKKHKIKQDLSASKEYNRVTKDVIIPELITVADLAGRMSEKTGDVVKKLFTMGLVATSNQVIDADTAELIVQEFGHNFKRVQESDVENILENHQDVDAELLPRAPVVTIMGHVDHGKTSLLDAIKSTNVVAGESGGITQHIGASQIKTPSGKYITFLDTPGHEAFTQMRSRGADVTDIVVLVVAADDGVKAQTVEAINHAKAANAPIIVAVNKIDKPGADPSKVKNELLVHEIVSEDLGGETMFIEVSAKQKLNLEALEEAILLQAEILELKAPLHCRASGAVIESRIDTNQGVVATLLVQQGELNISDIVVAGTSYGKVKKMMDSHGKNLKKATPSMPVEILGLDRAPNAGDQFSVVKEEKQARDIISYRSKKERDEKAMKNSARSIDDIFKAASKGSTRYLPIIVKGDVHGSVEAIEASLLKLNNDEVAIKIVHSATGGITESDINLAEVAGAIVIGFNVRANSITKDMARDKNIDIRYHSIIYNVVDEIKLLLGGMLDPVKNEEFLGQAEIRQVFKVSGAGKIAGCLVTTGLIKRGAKVRLLRDNVVIHDGDLKTLKRFKEDVKEVKHNFECGCALENYDDIKEGDIIECYEIVTKNRSL